MKRPELTAPERLEKALLLKYPNLDRETESMLDAKVEMNWPDWCYLPMAASYAIVSRGAEMGIAQRFMLSSGLPDLEAVSAVIPWRLHKAVYRFDPDLTAELAAQDTRPDNIPAALLTRMPFPCVFIEHPPGVPDCEGVFYFLEWDHRYPEAMELRAHYLFPDHSVVHLFYQYADDHDGISALVQKNNEEIYRKYVSGSDMPQTSLTRWDACMENAARHLSLLVYLCSDEPDISRTSDVPRPRGRGRIRTPKLPDIIDVGAYIGSVIRKSRALQKEPAASSSSDEPGAARRPHMRRAHWHLYWTGEGRAVPRVKWLSPIFVHGDGQTPPVVIHPVKP